MFILKISCQNLTDKCTIVSGMVTSIEQFNEEMSKNSIIPRSELVFDKVYYRG